MQKKNQWTLPRHGVITSIARCIVGPYVRWRYRVDVQWIPKKDMRQCLIVMNHQTPFDQFFIGMTFPQPVYYLATEDIFSLGWISKLLRFAVAPIPIKKQTMDIQAVLNCIRIAREGGTIALAPEGNRTYSGCTGYIKPSIVSLVRKLKLPLALFRIEGGYGVCPRWSDVVRKGKMRAYVYRMVEPDEYAAMDDDALFELIRQALDVNEANAESGQFFHKKSAEYLERMVYTCPDCGLSAWESHGDTCRCLTCGNTVRYLPTRELEGMNGTFPYRFAAEWYDAQCAYVNTLDLTLWTKTPMFRDSVKVSTVELYQKKTELFTEAEMCLYGDRITVTAGEQKLVFPHDTAAAVTVLGRNKLNIYADDTVYQIKGLNKGFNALKYVNIYHRAKNLREGAEHEQFLGL